MAAAGVGGDRRHCSDDELHIIEWQLPEDLEKILTWPERVTGVDARITVFNQSTGSCSKLWNKIVTWPGRVILWRRMRLGETSLLRPRASNHRVAVARKPGNTLAWPGRVVIWRRMTSGRVAPSSRPSPVSRSTKRRATRPTVISFSFTATMPPSMSTRVTWAHRNAAPPSLWAAARR